MQTIKQIFDKNVILSNFKYFLGYLRLSLLIIKNANTRIAYIWSNYACSTYIKNVFSKFIYIRNIYIEVRNLMSILVKLKFEISISFYLYL